MPCNVNIYKTIIFTREVVSAEGLLQPILLPKIYPALFDLYALHCDILYQCLLSFLLGRWYLQKAYYNLFCCPKSTLHCLIYMPYTVNIYTTIIFTREVVSAEGLLQPILLPKIYPALFDLYALHCKHFTIQSFLLGKWYPQKAYYSLFCCPKSTLHCLTYMLYTVNIYNTIIFTREVVSAECLLQPILLPKVYPALFDLYALHCEYLQNYHFY